MVIKIAGRLKRTGRRRLREQRAYAKLRRYRHYLASAVTGAGKRAKLTRGPLFERMRRVLLSRPA